MPTAMIALTRKTPSIPTVAYSNIHQVRAMYKCIRFGLKLLVPNGTTKNKHLLRGKLIRNLIKVGSIPRRTIFEEVN
jgi:hypothetical protein